MTATVLHGDCIELMRTLSAESVDSIACDPPYNLAFMGRGWDTHPTPLAFQQWCQEWATEALRVLKPGAHMLAFGGTRTGHRLTSGIEDAGFEIRDSIAWLHGNGFPKGKAQLKPAHEPITLARKSLRGTIETNTLEHGTGMLSIAACRLPGPDAPEGRLRHGGGSAVSGSMSGPLNPDVRPASPAGRWPPNVALDESQAAMLDQQTGVHTSGKLLPHHADNGKVAGTLGSFAGRSGRESYGDSGGTSRFFYCAKAPKWERPSVNGISHSTVKPLALMRWLVKLVTPPGGTVLDMFGGSGATAEAAVLEGFDVIIMEREADYIPLIEARLARVG